MHDVREEIRKLPQLHDQLWDLFKPVRNKKDMEQFEQLLADEALRQEFYARLKAFSRCLHISLSSDKLFDVFDEAKIDALKRDWKQFSELQALGPAPLPGDGRCPRVRAEDPEAAR